MGFALGTEILLVLALLSFLGGIIVATIGPGGILIVTGLYLLTPLSAAEVAGTSSATFTVGAILGSLVYARSGEIDWTVAGVVSAAAAAGTWIGVQANAYLSRDLYGLILAAMLATIAITQVLVLFTALFTTANYLFLGAIVAPLVFLLTGAYLGGVTLGWWLAHRIAADRLKLALGIVLLGLAASLVL